MVSGIPLAAQRATPPPVHKPPSRIVLRSVVHIPSPAKRGPGADGWVTVFPVPFSWPPGCRLPSTRWWGTHTRVGVVLAAVLDVVPQGLCGAVSRRRRLQRAPGGQRCAVNRWMPARRGARPNPDRCGRRRRRPRRRRRNAGENGRDVSPVPSALDDGAPPARGPLCVIDWTPQLTSAQRCSARHGVWL